MNAARARGSIALKLREEKNKNACRQAGNHQSAGRQGLMEKLGIGHGLPDAFRYREYRYGKLDDAVAQALRDREAAKVGRKDYYVRFGRRCAIPSTVQPKHEISRIVLRTRRARGSAGCKERH